MPEYPNDINPEFSVATAYEASGQPYDYIGNWETAIQYANDGYQVKVHSGDAHLSREELQAAVDREFAAAIDCFGEDRRK